MDVHRLLAIARKEAVQLRRDTRSLILAFGLPLFMVLFFGFAISWDVKDIRLAVWDQDGTPNESGASVGNNDLNVFDQCNGGPPAAASTNQLMNGFNDWANIRYNFLSSPHFVDGIHTVIEEDGDRTVR